MPTGFESPHQVLKFERATVNFYQNPEGKSEEYFFSKMIFTFIKGTYSRAEIHLS